MDVLQKTVKDWGCATALPLDPKRASSGQNAGMVGKLEANQGIAVLDVGIVHMFPLAGISTGRS